MTEAEAVLIVDDDADVIAALNEQVSHYGWTPHVARSAADAMEMLVQRRISVMLADIDVGPPDGDAVDLLQLVRQVSPTTRSILMCGDGDVRAFRRALAAGAWEVLPRPPTPQECEAALSRALDRPGGLRGSLHGVSLVDVLRIFHGAGRTAVLRVDLQNAVIVFQKGEIVHAEAGGKKGRAALQALLLKPTSTVRSEPLTAPVARSIEERFDTLIAEIQAELARAERHASLGTTAPYGTRVSAAPEPVESTRVSSARAADRAPDQLGWAEGVCADDPGVGGIVIDDPEMREASVVIPPPPPRRPGALRRMFRALCESFDLAPDSTATWLLRVFVASALGAAIIGFALGYSLTGRERAQTEEEGASFGAVLPSPGQQGGAEAGSGFGKAGPIQAPRLSPASSASRPAHPPAHRPADGEIDRSRGGRSLAEVAVRTVRPARRNALSRSRSGAAWQRAAASRPSAGRVDEARASLRQHEGAEGASRGAVPEAAEEDLAPPRARQPSFPPTDNIDPWNR